MMHFLSIVDFLEAHQLPCSIKALTGQECPGCGSQRALILLLKSDFFASIQAWPALLPLILTILFIALHLIFKFKNGSKVILVMLMITIAIALINYFIKMI